MQPCARYGPQRCCCNGSCAAYQHQEPLFLVRVALHVGNGSLLLTTLYSLLFLLLL
jgi:hypothetical protein